MHEHFTLVNSKFRGLSLAKFHMLKVCHKGINTGIIKYTGYFPKDNKNSVKLHIAMGMKYIGRYKNNTQVLLSGKLQDIFQETYKLINIK